MPAIAIGGEGEYLARDVAESWAPSVDAMVVLVRTEHVHQRQRDCIAIPLIIAWFREEPGAERRVSRYSAR